MRRNEEDHSYSWGSGFANRHPVIANILIISVIALLGLYAAYLSAALFTKHGRTLTVPGVENLTYTEAVEKLHAAGLKVDIRDSIYRDDLRPGIVIEQFPKARSVVKPGRKIFLYINSVHPKEVILDDDNHPSEYALKGESYRSALAKLEELGFKNIKMVKVLGVSDRVVKIIANGRPVRKMQKVPVNVSIVVEVSTTCRTPCRMRSCCGNMRITRRRLPESLPKDMAKATAIMSCRKRNPRSRWRRCRSTTRRRTASISNQTSVRISYDAG